MELAAGEFGGTVADQAVTKLQGEWRDGMGGEGVMVQLDSSCMREGMILVFTDLG